MLADLTVFQRVALGFGTLLALMIALAGFSWSNADRVARDLDLYATSAERSAALAEVVEDTFGMRLAAFAYRARGDEAAMGAALAKAEELTAFAREADALFAGAPAEDVAAVEALVTRTREYGDAFARATEATARRDAAAEAADAAAEAARAALARMRDVAAERGRAEAAAAAGAVLEGFLVGQVAVERHLLAPSDAAAERASTALAEADAATRELLPVLNAAGFAGQAFEAIQAVETARERFAAVLQAASARDRVFAGELDAIGPELERLVDAQVSLTRRRQAAAAADARAAADAGRLAALVGAAAILAVSAILAVALGRWIGGAMRRIAREMERAAAGDLDIDLRTASANRSEFGAMARALGVFVENQRALRRAEEAREAAEQAAAEARAETMRRLGEAFGGVVDAAVSGDFTRRVEGRFDDPEISALAEGLNRLLESVEHGVDAAGAAMRRLADGDLDAEMQGAYQGVFAGLKRDVDTTVARLAELVEEIKRGAGAIAGTAGTMTADADALAERAEGQAASLEETAATMEELSATVRGNADNAREAAALSREASQAAENGRDVVADTVAIIGRIEESSTRIADITSVIDGIAFQTNLLALNAAVEAARAGEAGKGFAVVAAEVRQLAQRSSEAANDIKGLIEDSGRQVSEGVSAARQAGESLEAIVASVRALGETISGISAASAEQSSGIEEISSAVASLDETTQRNAAMAQDAARGAGEVAATARRLEDLAAVFRSRGRGRAAAAA
jgi:methyl-accepting chemotaxis protein